MPILAGDIFDLIFDAESIGAGFRTQLSRSPERSASQKYIFLILGIFEERPPHVYGSILGKTAPGGSYLVHIGPNMLYIEFWKHF